MATDFDTLKLANVRNVALHRHAVLFGRAGHLGES